MTGPNTHCRQCGKELVHNKIGAPKVYCSRLCAHRWWAHNNRNRKTELARNNNLKKYGLTQKKYQELYDAQKGRCKICGTKEASSRSSHLHIDHCHATNKVRGLLCSTCNMALGAFRDKIELLKKAIEYLT